jgi:NAD dependent epimerase/dehydratase family enzyme
MAGEVLKSCTVSASKVLTTGFIYDHPSITGAVKSILGK